MRGGLGLVTAESYIRLRISDWWLRLLRLVTVGRCIGRAEAERLEAEKEFIGALPPFVDRDLLHYPGLAVPRNIRGLFHLGINNQQLRPVTYDRYLFLYHSL